MMCCCSAPAPAHKTSRRWLHRCASSIAIYYKEGSDMLAQSTQDGLVMPAQETTMIADRSYKSGRLVTIVMFAIVLVLLGLMFYWLGARRVNKFFLTPGDDAFQVQRYQDAVGDYSWAVRFDRSDAHSFLNRGYAYQKLNNNADALPDFT